ncbi:putative regulatory protein, FmdB family [Arthrobacter subterraneus]|uniref:Putative regulatory protein, FmdB family n=1 Tax=Arthrobacter subterraneus TaxID=335973 RepID=A0A1G8KAF1_9MICC|nr:zinc ribbon domain-containing protein [Arthrobacter subterraneus]SDI40367.1 putative regulatory protein, FmdB family [Arthrobacter subterraneus]
MPIYEYVCPQCDVFEVIQRMGTASEVDACPACGKPVRRKISAPHLAGTGAAAFKLIDSAERSASEPEVVSGALPSTGSRKTQPYSFNPLHKKLPPELAHWLSA